MAEPILTEKQVALHVTLIEAIRDTWPKQKGLDALLFQNDLFYRLKNLEDIAGGSGPGEVYPSGFLPGNWCADYRPTIDEAYLAAWMAVDAACEVEGWIFVDATEDLVVNWCGDMIPDRIAFFEAALDTGALDDEWMEKAELLKEAACPSGPPAPAPQEPVIELEPERMPSKPTRRRAGRPFTPTRVRTKLRNTRRHK
jgi:hypothetical protein